MPTDRPAACLVYVTTETATEADRIAEAVVGEGLAACANILGAMRAVFFWQGAVRDAPETALLLKTAVDRLDALTDRIKALHSYDEPCVVALPVVGGSASFIDWIHAESRGDRRH